MIVKIYDFNLFDTYIYRLLILNLKKLYTTEILLLVINVNR